ncbi:MAG: hypothetical protein LCH61_16670 [Proteobacteria bacterium]|nr:hypothetical protein [Pseudomonadota bacterium]
MHIRMVLALVSTLALANVAQAASSGGKVVIDDRVYAACTKQVLKELGTPPSQAAHFQDLWAAHAYDCAVRNSRKEYHIRG